MSKLVKVIILRTAGTNCDQEAAFAFESCGATVDRVHINQFKNKQKTLKDYHILVVPGGFTYGDDIESGKILANEMNIYLGDDIRTFINDGKLIIGICNGFQVLVKAGFLPGPIGENEPADRENKPGVTLTHNNSGKFEDRWVYLKAAGKGPWLQGVNDIIYLPVAHGEGKFIAENKEILLKLKENGQIAFRYCNAQGGTPDYPANPNGSQDDIAGITDKSGRVLGLMPHPERHFLFTQHPFWTRLNKNGKFGHGAKIFENGINYIAKTLI